MNPYFEDDYEIDDDDVNIHFNGGIFESPTLSHQREECDSESTGSSSSSCSPVKKSKMCPSYRCAQWLKQGLLQPLPTSLREKSAQALAVHWSANFRVKEEMKAMGSSNMALAFKVEVATHLKGHHLASFLRSHDGLDILIRQSWPEVGQRLVTAVYREMTRFNQTQLARQDLSQCIKSFRDTTKERTNVVMVIHRLGLTQQFCQPNLEKDNKIIHLYHQTQAERILCQGFCPMLIYPLPHILRIDPKQTSDMAEKCYLPCESVRANEKLVLQNVSSQDKWNENRGLVLSEASAEFRRNSYNDCEEWSHLENRSLVYRHFLLLNTIAQCSSNNAQPLVLVAAFLALIDPFYSGDRMTLDEPQRAPLVRTCQIDIYFYLSRALCWLHAAMDGPLACYEMAKKSVYAQQPPCLGEQAKLALMQQEMLVRYGHYSRARDVVTLWMDRLPSTSWMYEEFIMIHCAGVFYASQERIMAAYITNEIHQECKKLKITHCWEQHVKPLLQTTTTQLMLLKSLLYHCLADLTLRQQFRRDCHTALQIAELYMVTSSKMTRQTQSCYVDALRGIWERLKNSSTLNSSLHLEPFNNPLPYSVTSMHYWVNMIHNITSTTRQGLSAYAMLDKCRPYADSLFTMLVSLLIHSPPLPTEAKITEMTELALDMYRASTAGRHHRVGLLTRLLKLKTDFSSQHLFTDTCPVRPATRSSSATITQRPLNIYHPGATKEALTSEETLAREIRDYTSSTMKHCLNNFEQQNFSSPEMFCKYIRDRDSLTPVWIDAGLRVFRFAHGV